MAADSHDAQSRLEEVIAAYLEAADAGKPLDREQLVARHATLAEDLREFFAAHDELGEMAAPPSNDPPKPDQPAAQRDGATLAFNNQPTGHVNGHGSPNRPPREMVGYFGDYELRDEIARGGMGVVYKARQTNLDRTVALKMILAGQLASVEDVRRFYQEAEAAANLEHPNIVPIFEVGQNDGQHFFSMAYVDGPSLADLVSDSPLPPREAAEIVRQVAEAIAYAHSRGVIHRDLKPANVLLARVAERTGGGRSAVEIASTVENPERAGWYEPRVTDFGLAKRTEDASHLTNTGQILGTPSYMPPEQAVGSAGEITPAADVYSLGAILYCSLTGMPPFQAASPMDTLWQVLKKDPLPPRHFNPTIPRDLETICLKCLEKDPQRRYASAQAFADELGRYLCGEPIQARPVGPCERAWRWCKRNPVVATLLGLLVLSVVSGTVVATVLAVEASNRAVAEKRHRIAAEIASRAEAKQRRKAEAARRAEAKQRAQAEAARRSAEKSEKEAQWNLYAVRMLAMNTTWRERNLGELEQLLEDSKPPEGEPDFRGWEWYYFQDQCRQASEVLVGKYPFAGVDWCHATGKVALGTMAGTIEIRDDTTRKIEKTLPAQQFPVHELKWSPEGVFLACANGDLVTIWNARTAEVIRQWDTGYTTATLDWSPDGSKLSTAPGETTGEVKIWNAESGELLQTVDAGRPGYISYVRDMHWHPDAVRLATANRHGRVVVWDTTSGKKLITKTVGNSTPLDTVAWSPDGKLLAAGHVQGLTILDDQWRTVASVTGNLEAGQVRWSPGGASLAGGGNGQTVIVWNRDTGKSREYSQHDKWIRHLVWGPDGKRILVSGEGKARLFAVEQREFDVQVHRVGENFNDAHWSPDGAMLLCTHTNKTSFCDPVTGEVRQTFDSISPSGSAWHPSSKRACTLSYRGKLYIWDTSDSQQVKPVRTVNLERTATTDVDWSPDGKQIAVSSHVEGQTALWNTETWENAASLPGSQWCVSWSPAGDLLATGYSGPRSRLRVWDVQQRMSLYNRRLQPIRSAVTWSPDGRFVCGAGQNGQLVLLRAADGKLIVQCDAHKGPVTSVAWAPNGRRIATAGTDGKLVLWDAATVSRLITFDCGVPVQHVAWSPDNRRMVCVCNGGTLRIWGSPKIDVAPENATHLESGVLASVKTPEEEFAEEEARLTVAIETKPDDASVWRNRGIFYQMHQRWAKAAADFEQSLRWGSPHVRHRAQAARAHAMAGDAKAFAEHCRTISREFRDGTKTDNLATRVCAFGPFREIDYQSLLEAALRGAENHPDRWVTTYVPGAIYYRMGRYEEALGVLLQAGKVAKGGVVPAINHLWLAMTYHQLGQSELAKESLKHAAELCWRWMPAAGIEVESEIDLFIESHLIGYEAQKLILGPMSTATAGRFAFERLSGSNKID